MQISVFYSWQSESPEKTNRYLIRDALEGAMRNIQNEYGLNERPEINHDTKGTPGLPDIVQTIFSKIEASSAFVADVTFTSESCKGRLCANTNVLIELGFALHSLGDERIILVMNDAFGSPKDQMPFNLAARRWPITFTLQPGADKQAYKTAVKKLEDQLSIALKTMVNNGVLSSFPATNSSLQSDRLLFTKFLKQFPSNGEIAFFLRDCDVGDPIRATWLHSIEEFINEWSDTLHEFIEPTLESKRIELVKLLKAFSDDLHANIWTNRNNPEMLSMELSDIYDRGSRWLKRDELNEMSAAVYQKHQELLKLCKEKLGFPESN